MVLLNYSIPIYYIDFKVNAVKARGKNYAFILVSGNRKFCGEIQPEVAPLLP